MGATAAMQSSQARGLQNFIHDIRNATSKEAEVRAATALSSRCVVWECTVSIPRLKIDSSFIDPATAITLDRVVAVLVRSTRPPRPRRPPAPPPPPRFCFCFRSRRICRIAASSAAIAASKSPPPPPPPPPAVSPSSSLSSPPPSLSPPAPPAVAVVVVVTRVVLWYTRTAVMVLCAA